MKMPYGPPHLPKYFIGYLFLAFSLFAQTVSFSAATTTSTLEAKEVEEGWRYSKTLTVKVTYEEKLRTKKLEQTLDVRDIHLSMASLMRQSLLVAKDFESTKDKVLSIIRFTPIVMEAPTPIQLGRTISLPSTLMNGKTPLSLSPYQETVFASGWARGYNKNIQKFMVLKDCDSMFHPGKKIKKCSRCYLRSILKKLSLALPLRMDIVLQYVSYKETIYPLSFSKSI